MATSLLNVRTWGDARALVHVGAPVIAAAAVASGWVDTNLATIIVGLVLAVLSPAIATVNTVNGFRSWFYPVLGAASALLIALGYFTDLQYATWLPVITLLVGSAVAAANTPTTIDGTVESVRDTELNSTHSGGAVVTNTPQLSDDFNPPSSGPIGGKHYADPEGE